jgi:3-oxoacyl-[acyl-carrier protein] reductase
MDLGLNGRTALVTGSWRGTGLSIAQRLAAEGARVLVHGLELAQADAAVAEIGAGTPVAGDIATDTGARALLDRCVGEDVTILVNNYGTADPGNWTETDSDAWIAAYQRNVLSAQRMIRGLLPAMRTAEYGRIINLGTVGSTRPRAQMPHYYAAKGALATLTISLAREVAGTPIRVNLVSPGLIRTPEVEAAWIARGRARGWGDTWQAVEPHAAAGVPIGRIVRRQEVADLVAFLASPLADAIHGQNIRIDGGALDSLT